MFKRFWQIAGGIYWRNRYKLLRRYRLRVLSASHNELLTNYNAVVQCLRAHGRAGGTLPPGTHYHVSNIELIERGRLVQKNHGYKKEQV